MKLINTKNILTFVPEGDETATQKEFLEFMKQYTIKANGAVFLIYAKIDHLIISIKPNDNTQFICTSDGYNIAAVFGAKRFLVGEARKQINDEKMKQSNVIYFPRDLSFPVEKSINEVAINYNVLDFAGILKEFRTDKSKFYDVMAELFNRCADFTPGKQEEYLTGGKTEDKYCRFNLNNNTEQNALSTENYFLIDDKKNIIGTISATIINNKDGSLDIYFYDEIVDYFTLLNNDEIKELYAKTQQLSNEKDAIAKSALEKEIATLIEPKRQILIAQLFAAARLSIRNSIVDLDEKIEKRLVHAFIRAAAGRVDAYVDLGCSKTNTGNFVIHGAPTEPLKMLDAYAKNWAAEQLKALQPKLGSLSLLSQSIDNKADDLDPPTLTTSFRN